MFLFLHETVGASVHAATHGLYLYLGSVCFFLFSCADEGITTSGHLLIPRKRISYPKSDHFVRTIKNSAVLSAQQQTALSPS